MNLLTAGGLVPATDEDLLRCAQEPIHIPGSIQPHGVLISARLADEIVTHASQNLEIVTGVPAAHAIGAALASVIGAHAASALRAAIAAESKFSDITLNLTLPGPDGVARHFHVTSGGRIVIIEIEIAAAINDGGQVLEITQSLMMKMRMTQSLAMLSRLVTDELRAKTGYDRVMVYQFDRDGHGEVIAEALADGMTPYLHLRYPASDIPAQARRLYLMARLRLIPQVAYQPVPILAPPGDGPAARSLALHAAQRFAGASGISHQYGRRSDADDFGDPGPASLGHDRLPPPHALPALAGRAHLLRHGRPVVRPDGGRGAGARPAFRPRAMRRPPRPDFQPAG